MNKNRQSSIAFLILLITFAVFAIFTLSVLQQPSFRLEFSAPKIVSGDTTSLFITVVNNENETIKDLSLSFQSDLILGYEIVYLDKIAPERGTRYSLFVASDNFPSVIYLFDVTLNYSTSRGSITKTQRINLEVFEQEN